MAYQSFEDLEGWKRSCQLAVDLYDVLRDCRDFGMKDQMQRAAGSIPSNIAGGWERGGKDFARFLPIPLGSAAGLRAQMYIAKKTGMLPDSDFTAFISEVRVTSKMLMGLKRSLEIDH